MTTFLNFEQFSRQNKQYAGYHQKVRQASKLQPSEHFPAMLYMLIENIFS